MRLLFLSIFTFITLNSQAQYFLYWNDEFEQAEINSANIHYGLSSGDESAGEEAP